MAEFCLDCLNKFHFSNAPLHKIETVESIDLCEDCGLQKQCVIRIREPFRTIRNIKHQITKRFCI